MNALTPEAAASKQHGFVNEQLRSGTNDRVAGYLRYRTPELIELMLVHSQRRHDEAPKWAKVSGTAFELSSRA